MSDPAIILLEGLGTVTLKLHMRVRAIELAKPLFPRTLLSTFASL